MADLLAGPQVILGDRYAIERELGRGGMATVYLARDIKQDRQVAVKVLHPDLSVALGPERFRREIQTVSHLSHPHILPIYDSGGSDGSLFFVMPYAGGESLRARLDRERQLSVDEAVRITCEVASALDHAHRHGVVHRDIKPENILLEDGQAIVADFGIARAVNAIGEERLTQTGLTLGTPMYMSPEQAMAERQIDGRSDVYSLGCVLYEMLAGQPPFVGPTAQAIIARHTLEQVPSLTIVRASIPDEVEDAVLRALAKVPADRFATAAQFSESLKACRLSGGSSLGPAERRTRPRRKPVEGRRFRPALLGSVLAGVLGVGLVGWGLLRRPEPVAGAAAGSLDSRSVAVLYFSDASGSGELAHLADGLTEALIDELEQVRTLDVISRDGVSPYRNAEVSADSIARALKVGSLVDGSVEENGGRVRVAVRLLDGASGVDLNRKSFEVASGDPFAIRDSLAEEVARFLRQRLGEEIVLRERKGSTRSVPAWLLLQRAELARKEAEERLVSDDPGDATRQFRLADSLLAQSEALDPKWTEPIVLRSAIAYRQSRVAADKDAAERWIDSGLAHAARALNVEPKNARALELRGTLRYWRYLLALEHDPRSSAALFRSAADDLRSAVTLDPSRASAWSTLSHLYYQIPDLIEAKLAARRAYEEDAYLAAAPEVVWRLYTTSLDLEQLPDAVRWCEEGQQRFPANGRFVTCQLWLMIAGAERPDTDRAWQLREQLRQLTPEDEWAFAGREAQMLVGAVLARSGLADSARRLLVQSRATRDIDPEHQLLETEAVVRALLGDRDEAFRLLKLYLAAHPDHRAAMAESQSWLLRDLRGDPRFKELIGG